MNFNKYITLIVGCGIALVLALAATVFLVLQISANAKVQVELKSALSKLDVLNKRKTYPNQENISQTTNNWAVLTKVLGDTQIRLRVGQLDSGTLKREFTQELEDTIKLLGEKASSSAVGIPEHFAFGFDSYFNGALPATDSIPRLVIQLKTVDSLCRILFAANISNLVSISREEFEGGMVNNSSRPGNSGSSSPGFLQNPASPGRSPSATSRDIPQTASNDLYTVERISLDFEGHENSIWEVLNSLARGTPFCVVRDISLETAAAAASPSSTAGGSRPGVTPSGVGVEYSTGRSDGLPAMGVSTNLAQVRWENRVVSGRETVHALLVVDTFRFAASKGVSK